MPEIIGTTQVGYVIPRQPHLKVSVKRKWAEEWSVVPYLTVEEASFGVGPQFDRAVLRWEYGRLRHEDMSDYADISPQWLVDQFVRIQAVNAADAQAEGVTIDSWVGVIVSDEKILQGLSTFGGEFRTPAGRELITAYGLGLLLDRSHIATARFFQPLPAGWEVAYPQLMELPIDVDRLPSFNLRNSSGRSVMGNWGTGNILTPQPELFDAAGIPVPDDEAPPVVPQIGYGFRHPDDGGRVGNWRELVEYLLEHDGPRYDVNAALPPDEDGEPVEPEYSPLFTLSGQVEILEAITEVVPLDNRSVWQLLGQILDRRRGIGFRVVTAGEPGAQVQLEVVSLTEDPVTAGGVTLPANLNQFAFRPDPAIDIESIEVLREADATYDRILVRGALQKVQITLSFKDRTLEAGWTDDQLQAFKDALKDTLGYDALQDKAFDNDEYRNQDDRFSRVGTTFRAPKDWDWRVGDGENGDIDGRHEGDLDYNEDFAARWNASPRCNEVGEIDWSQNADFARMDHRFLSTLLTQQGVDLTTGVAFDSNPEGSEPIFERPFVLAYWDETQRWHAVERLSAAVLDGIGENASVFIRDREISLDVRFPQRQWLLGEDWSGAEPTYFDPSGAPAGLKWRKMIAVVAIETDFRPKIEYWLTNPASAGDVQRTLVVDIEDAERWLLIGRCVLGLGPRGTSLIRNKILADFDSNPPSDVGVGGRVLRDDLPRLQAVAAFLAAWHSKYRASVRMTVKNLQTYVRPGVMLLAITTADGSEQQVNTVVTRVRHTFNGGVPRTTIETNYLELDASRGFDERDMPTQKTAASRIKSTQTGLAKLQSEMA